jgi:hypothetical protein
MAVFSMVTVAVFIIEHIFAIALLVAAAAAAVVLSRRSRTATRGRSLARPPATSGVIVPRGHVCVPAPHWGGVAGMSSAAVGRARRRGLPHSEGWSGQ